MIFGSLIIVKVYRLYAIWKEYNLLGRELQERFFFRTLSFDRAPSNEDGTQPSEAHSA
jgi:hypothetical protein